MFNGRPFPVDAFPKTIRNAIYEVEQHTQTPQSLIAASTLEVISFACQDRVDVCRLNNLRGPVSLFLMTLAESGERKNTVDKLLMRPLYQLEGDLFEEYTHDLTTQRNDEAIFSIERKVLMSEPKSDIQRNKDHLTINRRLKGLLATNPKAPVGFKFLFDNATPAAIKVHLCGHWQSIGIMSGGAETIFNGYTLNELPFINKMWDGSIFTVERKNELEKLVRDAGITLSLMVQPNVFKGYIDGKGGVAKGIGLFARCLICQPTSAQDNRKTSNPIFSNEHLSVFHQRLMEIINESIIKINEDSRICLRFFVETERHWIGFYNQIESEVRTISLLYDFKDYASKMTKNMARLAALSHHFSGDGDGISATAVRAAVEIVTWRIEEYIRLFSKREKFSLDASETDEFYYWIGGYCMREFSSCIKKNIVLQFGPNKFRSRDKANELIRILISQSRIFISSWGKTKIISITHCVF